MVRASTMGTLPRRPSAHTLRQVRGQLGMGLVGINMMDLTLADSKSVVGQTGLPALYKEGGRLRHTSTSVLPPAIAESVCESVAGASSYAGSAFGSYAGSIAGSIAGSQASYARSRAGSTSSQARSDDDVSVGSRCFSEVGDPGLDFRDFPDLAGDSGKNNELLDDLEHERDDRQPLSKSSQQRHYRGERELSRATTDLDTFDLDSVHFSGDDDDDLLTISIHDT